MSLQPLTVTTLRVPEPRLHNAEITGSPKGLDAGTALTLARMPLGALGVWQLYVNPTVALVLFAVFAAVDLGDGVVARSNGTETGLRRILDVVIDRIAIGAALIALVELGYLTASVALFFIGRDVVQAIASGRFTARYKSVLVGPHWHMSYGLSILGLVAAAIFVPAALSFVTFLAGVIAIACLTDFLRRIRLLTTPAA